MSHFPPIPPSWQAYLSAELDKSYMKKLADFLGAQDDKTIYPAKEQWFAALEHTAFDDVKVVILGQDPYHGEQQAHGLSFSVPTGIKIPPSLRNIFRELDEDPDISFRIPTDGCLTGWADQGVLLLNATLTVEAHRAGSHQHQGWETFTDVIIQQLNKHREHLVFMLWGNYAQQKGDGIDSNRHHILQTTHPSPFSAYRGFRGCQHFSKANKYLQDNHQALIQW